MSKNQSVIQNRKFHRKDYDEWNFVNLINSLGFPIFHVHTFDALIKIGGLIFAVEIKRSTTKRGKCWTVCFHLPTHLAQRKTAKEFGFAWLLVLHTLEGWYVKGMRTIDERIAKCNPKNSQKITSLTISENDLLPLEQWLQNTKKAWR